MHGSTGSPAKPEQTYREGEGTDNRGREDHLRFELFRQHWRDEALLDPEEVRRHGDSGKHQDAQENEALFTGREVIDASEDEGKRLKPDEEHAVQQAGKQVHKENDRLAEGENERSSDEKEVLSGGVVCRVDFRPTLQAVVSRGLAEALGAVVEDVVCTSLGKEEEHDNKHHATQPSEDPDGPAPALYGSDEPTDQRPQHGAEDAGGGPDAHAILRGGGRIDVVDGAATRRQARATAEAGHPAEDEKDGDVGGKADDELEENKGHKGPKEDARASETGHLGQRRPEHRTEAVSPVLVTSALAGVPVSQREGETKAYRVKSERPRVATSWPTWKSLMRKGSPGV